MPGLVCPDLPRACLIGPDTLIRPPHGIADRPADQSATEAVAEINHRLRHHAESRPPLIVRLQNRGVEATGDKLRQQPCGI